MRWSTISALKRFIPPGVHRLTNLWRAAAGALLVLVTRLVTLPRTPWESDEFLFIDAVREFDPSRHHPHPPGYPLFVGLGKVFAIAIGDPFHSLVVLNVVACVIGFIALHKAIERFTSDSDLAICGALLFYLSAGMLVHSPLALSDATTIMFLSLWLCAVAFGNTTAAAVFAAFAIGCRPQIAMALFPGFVASHRRRHSWRRIVASFFVFAVACLLWFVPLVVECGGPAGFLSYIGAQASYVASHDATHARGAIGILRVAVRFVAHAWGRKEITIPLFLAAAAGLLAMRRRTVIPLAPWIVFTGAHFAFAIAAMDPADGVRYSLPGQMFIAFLAARGLLLAGRPFVWAGTLALGAASIWYASPILFERASYDSPAFAAASAIRPACSSGTIVAWDAGTRPVVESLLPQCRTMALEEAMRQSGGQIVLFDDGASRQREARVFAWPMSDAYGKLTRNVLRTITLDPIRDEERFVAESGVYALERTPDGEEWRWLAGSARLRVPNLGLGSISMTFRLPPDAPDGTVAIDVNGRALDVRRGESTIEIPWAPVVEIRAAHTFRPADVIGNRDPRPVSVELATLEQKP